MQEQAYEQLTLFQVVSPANPLVWLESRKAGKMTVICGLKCCGLSGSLARVGSSVRTYLESCELPLQTLSRTWSAKVIASSCWILKLRLSERRIDVRESRLWATPTAADSAGTTGGNQVKSLRTDVRMWPTPEVQTVKHIPQTGLWKTPVAADASNRKMYVNSRGEPNLSGQVKLFPTPRASDGEHGGPNQRDSRGNPSLAMAARLIPTPTARDYKDGSANACRNVPVNGLLGRAVHFLPTPRAQSANGTGKSRIGHREDLQTYAAKTTQEDNRTEASNGQLNPTWVEWLMGFPQGWTDLNA